MTKPITLLHSDTLDGAAINVGDYSEEFSDTKPGHIEFRIEGETVVTIKPDGSVIVNPKFTTTEAAQVFWEAVVALKPWRQ